MFKKPPGVEGGFLVAKQKMIIKNPVTFSRLPDSNLLSFLQIDEIG